MAHGIRHILDGTIRAFDYEYESSSPTLRRWFRVIVTPKQGSPSYGAVVMHINVSDLKQAEAADLLGIAERTVKRRWQSARLMLHEALKGQMPEL